MTTDVRIRHRLAHAIGVTNRRLLVSYMSA
jgi:hypothetical protein